MAYGLSNGHVTDDVTWPPNVRSAILVTAWLLVYCWHRPLITNFLG